MDRYQKKCLIAATAGHVLLFLLVAFGSAFLNRKPEIDTLPRLKFVPSMLIEEMLAGGGGNANLPVTDASPAARPAIPPSAGPTEVPPLTAVEPPQPTPKTREPISPPAEKPEPAPLKAPRVPPTRKPDVKPTPTKVEKTKPPVEIAKLTPDLSKPVPTKKPQIEIDPTKVVIRNPDEARRKAKEEAEKKERQEAERRAQVEAAAASKAAVTKRQEALQSSLQSLASGFSKDKGVTIEVGGPGGIAYGNYTAFVKAAYDNAWIVSPSLGDDDKTTEVSVTVLRSGEILSALITRPSGLPALDKSVETALKSVKNIRHQFPEGAREDQRTFTIQFNLKAKRQSG